MDPLSPGLHYRNAFAKFDLDSQRHRSTKGHECLEEVLIPSLQHVRLLLPSILPPDLSFLCLCFAPEKIPETCNSPCTPQPQVPPWRLVLSTAQRWPKRQMKNRSQRKSKVARGTARTLDGSRLEGGKCGKVVTTSHASMVYHGFLSTLVFSVQFVQLADWTAPTRIHHNPSMNGISWKGSKHLRHWSFIFSLKGPR